MAPPVGPSGEHTDELPAEELFRRLLPRCRDLYLATEVDLRRVVPRDLPQILRVDEWEHSDAVRDVVPEPHRILPGCSRRYW